YIGCPDIKSYPSPQNADGATSYTFSAQVKDKSINRSTPCGEGKPLLAPNITCKLWLTKDLNSINSLQKDAPDILKAANFQTPFPKEETTAFIFDPQTPQVQPCSKTGPTTWNYKLSPTLKSGTYYLSIIADWQGKRYNWRSQEVSIQGQS
ncbi:MAG: hypothetical protein J2P36_10855, partial [Ktedonobacteraceae bacterium]|nr:hypothetical protein [Ktedonobacteraceae bacterium]